MIINFNRLNGRWRGGIAFPGWGAQPSIPWLCGWARTFYLNHKNPGETLPTRWEYRQRQGKFLALVRYNQTSYIGNWEYQEDLCMPPFEGFRGTDHGYHQEIDERWKLSIEVCWYSAHSHSLCSSLTSQPTGVISHVYSSESGWDSLSEESCSDCFEWYDQIDAEGAWVGAS